MLRVAIPGGDDLCLEHLVLDVNGTLSDRGALIAGVDERLRTVGEHLALHMLSADTFGAAENIADRSQASFRHIRTGDDKRGHIERLGAKRCVAIGNGSNDVPMLQAAALGIAVLGPEGTSVVATAAATIVCRSVLEALDLLSDPRALTATLRP